MFSLVVFDNTLQDTNMERNMSSIDRQQNGIIFVVDIDHIFFKILGQILFALVALKFATLNIFLFLKISIEILINPFFQFFELLSFQNQLMFVPFLLVL
jgi:hypothetical protein